MDKYKNYIWSIPLIGGIISLIALLTPAAYDSSMENYYYYWIWGFVSYKIGYIEHIGFDEYILSLIPSIICSSILITSMVILIISSNKYRKGISNMRLFPGILIITITIVWILLMEIADLIQFGSSFWEPFYPGFGVIGMFIGGALSIIGYAVQKKIREPRKDKNDITPRETEFN